MGRLKDEYNRILSIRKVTVFQKDGMILEAAKHIALNNLGIPHNHNPFDERYAESEGKGVDFEIPTSKGKIGIESKHNNGKYGMSPYWIRREITKRFEDGEWLIRLVVCAFLTICHETMQSMQAIGYNFIELGFKITSFEKFKKAISVLTRKLYWIKKKFFPEPKPKFKTSPLRQKTLTCYPMSIPRESFSSVVVIKSINKQLNYQVKQQVEQGQVDIQPNYALNQIYSLLKGKNLLNLTTNMNPKQTKK